MELEDEITIPASLDDVYEALNDIAILKACIPGCEELIRNDNGELEYFQPLVPGNIFSSTQVERKLRTESGASNITFLPEIVTDLRSNKGSVTQSKPGDSRLSSAPKLETTHGINHFIPEFNTMADLGEKV